MVLMNLRSSDFVRLFHLRNLLGGLTLLGLAHTVQAEDGIVSTVRGGNLVFAAVSINHSPATWWLVDTGATMCEFDLEAANRLHLTRSRIVDLHVGQPEC